MAGSLARLAHAAADGVLTPRGYGVSLLGPGGLRGLRGRVRRRSRRDRHLVAHPSRL